MTSFRNYNTNIPQHLFNEEFEALENLSANCNLVIQRANKGTSVALVDKDVYIRCIEKILDDAAKFQNVKIKKEILHFSINHERRINDYLKSLEKSGSLTTDQYEKIKAKLEVDQGFYVGFARYRKLSLMFVRHLDLYQWRLELLVINLQSF